MCRCYFTLVTLVEIRVLVTTKLAEGLVQRNGSSLWLCGTVSVQRPGCGSLAVSERGRSTPVTLHFCPGPCSMSLFVITIILS